MIQIIHFVYLKANDKFYQFNYDMNSLCYDKEFCVKDVDKIVLKSLLNECNIGIITKSELERLKINYEKQQIEKRLEIKTSKGVKIL